jgi:hypothetical protein
LTSRITATLLLGIALSAPLAAFASEQNEQVIPPAVYENELDATLTDPISMENVVITHLTPADEFANAMTPLVVALGMGSMGLVIYTLVNKERQPRSPD